ncbi:TetR/AcrR family transcriptional regulator [Nesterenkonia ebinurensis]|uniref:TetR/AcrR family transcriptional regulator n=1 Tax=Nesterenkonia ebinurensis TaxID=2608252 RepID=UPI00123D1DEF|nr:TetR/AcrR family transcriptional regulator [Nesterenkonia ebinurensis]
MPTATRQRIIEAADDLFYRRGFDHTSFADIAGEVHISRGNFYHHFRTKDEILAAVIEARQASTRAMIRLWEDQEPTPEGRIRCFIRIVITNGALIERYGCPVGTLTSELAKLDHPCMEQARSVFSVFRDWLTEQFTALGHKDQADELAMRVLAFSQGVATLHNAFGDEAFVQREVGSMEQWLSTYSEHLKRKEP